MSRDFFTRDLDRFFAQLFRHSRERVLEIPPAGAIDLCSNDYLCLTQHAKLIDALHEGIDKYGAGSSASRLVRGHREAFDALEHKLAAWQGSDAALFFANGYAANVGALSAICDSAYAAFIDRLSHASLVDGIRLSGADKIYFRHNDMEHLRTLLQKCSKRKRIIISESIFSMDGDRAPLEELSRIAQEFDALLYIDDAHATGLFGAQGRGLASGSMGAGAGAGADFHLTTFGKALGLEGAAVVTSHRARRYLLHTARPFVFSTAPLPAIAHAALVAIDLVASMEKERQKIAANATRLRAGIINAGFACGPSNSQIVPLFCRSEKEALALSGRLLEAGFHAKAIRPPTVKEPRIRFSLNAAVTEEDIDCLVEVLAHA